MRLGPAKPDDALALAQIMAGWIDEMAWMPKLHTPEQDHRFLLHLIETTKVTAARDDQGLLGFMARDGEEILALYLKPSVRRQGLGTALLNQAKTATKRIELWTFQANTGARSFYAREGFSEVERTNGDSNHEKQPDVRMVWTEVESVVG